MAKPASKSQLLAESQAEFEALEQLHAPLSAENMTHPGMLGEWSVKDVLAHLYEWQQLFFGWYEAGVNGEAPQRPGRGYKWNQLQALNQEIFQLYRDVMLDEILAKFHASHQRIIGLILSHAEADLLAPGYFAWMGKHNLAAVISANTGNHYRWARLEMHKRLKPRKKI